VTDKGWWKPAESTAGTYILQNKGLPQGEAGREEGGLKHPNHRHF